MIYLKIFTVAMALVACDNLVKTVKRGPVLWLYTVRDINPMHLSEEDAGYLAIGFLESLFLTVVSASFLIYYFVAYVF